MSALKNSAPVCRLTTETPGPSTAEEVRSSTPSALHIISPMLDFHRHFALVRLSSGFDLTLPSLSFFFGSVSRSPSSLDLLSFSASGLYAISSVVLSAKLSVPVIKGPASNPKLPSSKIPSNNTPLGTCFTCRILAAEQQEGSSCRQYPHDPIYH